MILSPSYTTSPRLVMDRGIGDLGVAIERQHRRLASMLGGFDDAMWATPSRCDGWTARDVAAHLVGVNNFWTMSIQSGIDGEPTRMLSAFDPAATPPLLVQAMAQHSNQEVLAKFVSASDELLGVLGDLDIDEWSTLAESPVGHVPISLIVHHALWDSWVHERDIAVPLGLRTDVESDEVSISLRYVAALSPALALGFGQATAGRFAVDASDPEVRLVIDVDDSVSLQTTSTVSGIPCLHGDAVMLTEALSLRAPMPADTPAEWEQLLSGLKSAFDAGPE